MLNIGHSSGPGLIVFKNEVGLVLVRILKVYVNDPGAFYFGDNNVEKVCNRTCLHLRGNHNSTISEYLFLIFHDMD